MNARPRRVTAAMRKMEGIQSLRQARELLLNAVHTLPTSVHERVFLGAWGAKVLVAHLIGWDIANWEGVQAIRSARLPAFYAHIDRDWALFNVHLVATFGGKPLPELIEDAHASHAQLLTLLDEVPAADFNHDFGVRFRGYKVTITRLLAAESSDERQHAEQVLAFARVIETNGSIGRGGA